MREYVAELQELSHFCQFSATANGAELTSQIVLEDHLRDRFMCEVNNAQIQRRLLGERGLMYEKAIDVAVVMESANEGTTQLLGRSAPANGHTAPIHVVKLKPHHSKSHAKKSDDNFKKQCFRCGQVDNMPDKCCFKTTTSHFCKKKGHIALNCFAKKTSMPTHRTIPITLIVIVPVLMG